MCRRIIAEMIKKKMDLKYSPKEVKTLVKYSPKEVKTLVKNK